MPTTSSGAYGQAHKVAETIRDTAKGTLGNIEALKAIWQGQPPDDPLLVADLIALRVDLDAVTSQLFALEAKAADIAQQAIDRNPQHQRPGYVYTLRRGSGTLRETIPERP